MAKKGRLLDRILFFLAVFLCLSLPSRDVHSGQVTLTWDANTAPGITGYKIYYGPASGTYYSLINVGNLTAYTVSGLEDGTTYYFAVTDYNASGQESTYSNEVFFTTPTVCTYSISPTSQTFTPAGGTGTVSVDCGADCPWTAVRNASWIVITSYPRMTGPGAVNYSVSKNRSTASRTGTMTIAGNTFTVTQEGTPPPCSYTISPRNQSFSASGGTGVIKVTTRADCSWSAKSNAGWISVSPAGGTGNGSVTFSVSPNTSRLSRRGTLTVAGQTFIVTQLGRSR